MLDNFKIFLIEQGYSEFTPSGNPSTVYDYGIRINKICERENISIISLASKIDEFVAKYGSGGKDEEFGNKSHKAYINALKRFKEFIDEH